MQLKRSDWSSILFELGSEMIGLILFRILQRSRACDLPPPPTPAHTFVKVHDPDLQPAHFPPTPLPPSHPRLLPSAGVSDIASYMDSLPLQL